MWKLTLCLKPRHGGMFFRCPRRQGSRGSVAIQHSLASYSATLSTLRYVARFERTPCARRPITEADRVIECSLNNVQLHAPPRRAIRLTCFAVHLGVRGWHQDPHRRRLGRGLRRRRAEGNREVRIYALSSWNSTSGLGLDYGQAC